MSHNLSDSLFIMACVQRPFSDCENKLQSSVKLQEFKSLISEVVFAREVPVLVGKLNSNYGILFTNTLKAKINGITQKFQKFQST